MTSVLPDAGRTAVRLHVEVSLTVDEMAAALYYERYLAAGDLAHAEDVRDALTAAVAAHGLTAIRQGGRRLGAEIDAGTIDAAWLIACRRRLSEVFSTNRRAGRPMRDTRRAIARRVAVEPGMQPRELSTALGISHQTVRRACARMAADGQLSRDAAGRYFPPMAGRDVHAVEVG